MAFILFPLMESDGYFWHRWRRRGVPDVSLDRYWLSPSLVALVLTALILVLDVLLPNLPGAQGGLVGRLTALMSGVCPQRPGHSYTLGGVQLPLEARMMGMFGGLTSGVIELATLGRRRTRRWPRLPIALALLLGFGVMVFDGFNALFFDLGLPHAYVPDLRLRLATGVLAGIAMAFALMPALAQVEEVSCNLLDSTAPRWRDVGWTGLAAGSFAFLVASGWGVLLHPVALVGAGGVVLFLTLVNRIVLGGLTSRGVARPARRGREWWLSSLAAGLAVAELAVLAALRVALLSW